VAEVLARPSLLESIAFQKPSGRFVTKLWSCLRASVRKAYGWKVDVELDYSAVRKVKIGPLCATS
jgi:hypothetical protein